MNLEDWLLENALEMIWVDVVIVVETLPRRVGKLRTNTPPCSHQENREQDEAIL